MRKFIALPTFLLMAMAVYAPPARAQSVSKSYTLQVFSGGVVSPSFPNVGQSAHQFYGCLAVPSGSTSASSTLELEASTDGVNYFAISSVQPVNSYTAPLAGQTGCVTLSANGYYAAVRVHVLALTINGGTATTASFAGTYSGSTGVSPVGGEARAAAAAEKVSPVPSTATYINAALQSTPVEVVTAPTSNAVSSATYVYGVLVSNPNASTVVYVQVGNNATVSTSPQLIVPVAGSGVSTITFPAPVYIPNSVYVACSTAVASASDPATGCVVELLYTTVSGVNSNITALGGVFQTDNGPGSIPHE